MKLEGEKRSRWRLVVIAAIVVAGVRRLPAASRPTSTSSSCSRTSREKLGDWTYALVGALAFLETGAFVGLVFPGRDGGDPRRRRRRSGRDVDRDHDRDRLVLRLGGRHDQLLDRHAGSGATSSSATGRRCGSRHERFEQVEGYFARHGGKTILIGRFIGLVRALAPFIAGSSGMRYRGFVPYSVLGTGLWAAAFSLLGYALAHSLDRATELAGKGALVFGSAGRGDRRRGRRSRATCASPRTAGRWRSGSSRRRGCGWLLPRAAVLLAPDHARRARARADAACSRCSPCRCSCSSATR